MIGQEPTQRYDEIKLSKVDTNHQICKMTAMTMLKQGFNLKEISNITKYKNLQFLQHYISAPIHDEKENYSKVLFYYGKTAKVPKILPKKKCSQCKNKDTSKEKVKSKLALVPVDIDVDNT